MTATPMPWSARPALLVIDLQNAYFESPTLAAARPGLVERTNQLSRAARAGGHPVVLVRTVHARDRSTWTLNMLEDDQGFAFDGTEQAEFVPGLETTGAIDVTKTRDNAFHGTELREVLAGLGVGRLLIAGVSTHSCVAATAAAAFAHDLRVAIAAAAIASDDEALSRAALTFMAREMRQPVLDQSESLALLSE